MVRKRKKKTACFIYKCIEKAEFSYISQVVTINQVAKTTVMCSWSTVCIDRFTGVSASFSKEQSDTEQITFPYQNKCLGSHPAAAAAKTFTLFYFHCKLSIETPCCLFGLIGPASDVIHLANGVWSKWLQDTQEYIRAKLCDHYNLLWSV